MMEPAERELLARSVQHAVAHHDGPALDDELAEVGWTDALAVDPHTAISFLFEQQGRANRVSSALDQVVVSTLGHDPAGAGVVYPALGGWGAPGHRLGDHAEVHGLAGAGLARHGTVLVAIDEGGETQAALVPTASLVLRPVAGIDPALGLVEVGGSTAERHVGEISASWETAISRAQLAIGHELVGASRQLLELARDHALSRVQFGRPIGTFQAVRHRLADTLVALETADAALGSAWLDQTPVAAAMAKALAGRAAATAARHCQQVLAGIGFTTEHSLHRYVRRVLVLNQLFGSSSALTRALGEQLLRSRCLPPLTPL